MYYKDRDIPYENICNIISGFPKYYKIFSDGFRVIDTYDLVSVKYYREINIEKLIPISKEEWDIVEGIVELAYQNRRDLFFN
jgi:hypothetical protein